MVSIQYSLDFQRQRISYDIAMEPMELKDVAMMPPNMDSIGDHLASIDDFWDHWGFEPWERGPLAGVSRLQRFVKDGFLGPIAEYQAWDCIVWRSGTEEDRKKLWDGLSSLEGVMTQRFLFLLEDPWPERRIKSFFMGFNGYVEFYAYRPRPDGGAFAKEVKDLAGLVDMGLRLKKIRERPEGMGQGLIDCGILIQKYASEQGA